MADISLRTDAPGGVTCVSNAFIDEYMTGANGEFVKVYLYLLRSLSRRGEDFSLTAVADDLNNTESDIMRALKYWQKVGLLSLEVSRGELIGVCLNDPIVGVSASISKTTSNILPVEDLVMAPSSAISTDEAVVSKSSPSYNRPNYNPAQIGAFSKDEAVSDLLYVSERYLGKPLSNNDINTLLFWYDELSMDPELIEYLIESCVDSGHPSFYYMDAIALNWYESGVKTIEDAKKEKDNRFGILSKVKSAMGLNRDLADSEQKYIAKWKTSYNMSEELIVEACQRTIIGIGKVSFPYADSILERWSKAGVTSMDDVKKLDSTHSELTTKPKPTSGSTFAGANFSQRDYDYKALELALLSQK